MESSKLVLLGIAVFSLLSGVSCIRKQAPQPVAPAKNSHSSHARQPVEIPDVLEALVGAIEADDASRVSALLSSERTVRESEKLPNLRKLSASERATLSGVLATSALRMLKADGGNTWTRLTLDKTDVVEDEDQAVAFTQIELEDGGSLRMQFWLSKEKLGWRIYDWKKVGEGMRVSTRIGTMVASLSGDSNSLYVHLLAAAARLANEGKLGEADRFLQRIADIELPEELESQRWTLYARIKSSQGLAEEALRCLEFADAFQPDQPTVLALQSAMHCTLGNYETALEAARQAADRLEDKARGFALIGNALRGLKRDEEAANAYRQGLAADPNSLENLGGLGSVLSTDEMPELAQRLGNVTDSRDLFEKLASEFLASNRLDALNTVVVAIRQIDANSPLADYYDAEARLLIAEFDDAATLFESAHSKFTDARFKQLCARKLLDAFLAAGQPLEAYKRASDPSYAFGYLAGELLASKYGAQLSELVAAHRARLANDVRLHYYSGHANALAGRLADAEKDFAAGMAGTEDEDERERFRSERVLTLFRLGKSLEAYQQVAPRQLTYEQLTRLLADAEQADMLEALIKSHRENSPDDPTLGLWEGEVRWIRGDYQGVIAVFSQKRDAILADDLNRDRYEDRLIRSLVRLGRFYEALNIAKTSSFRDGDPWFETVVHAAAGNISETTHLLDYCARMGYTTKDFHNDPDLGPALRTDEFTSLRNKYPTPSAEDSGETIITIIE